MTLDPESQAYWIAKYQDSKALWIHDGHPARPHAELSSGKHSNGFFNSELVMEDPTVVDQACRQLTRQLIAAGLDPTGVSRVVGPAMGGITLAHDMARHLAQRGGHRCLRGYTEKDESSSDGKRMKFTRTVLREGEGVLPVEDVIVTAGSVERMCAAVTEGGGIILPYCAVLVNRTGKTHINGALLVALIEHPMPMWEPGECPLCPQGSVALRPKGTENWARLNAQY